MTMVDKVCARCKGAFCAPSEELFITCPSCRKPLTKKNLGKAKRMKYTKANCDRFDPSPADENNVRHLEDG